MPSNVAAFLNVRASIPPSLSDKKPAQPDQEETCWLHPLLPFWYSHLICTASANKYRKGPTSPSWPATSLKFVFSPDLYYKIQVAVYKQWNRPSMTVVIGIQFGIHGSFSAGTCNISGNHVLEGDHWSSLGHCRPSLGSGDDQSASKIEFKLSFQN